MSPLRRIPLAFLAISQTLWCSVAFAAPGLGSLKTKIDAINAELVVVGGALAIAGFVWALLCVMFGIAGMARAFSVLVVGLLISVAPQVVGFFTGM